MAFAVRYFVFKSFCGAEPTGDNSGGADDACMRKDDKFLIG